MDEMGSHSVMPSTMPIKIALMISQNVRNPSFLHTRERAAFLEMQHDANEDSLPEINLLLAQTVLQQKIAVLPEIHSGYPVVIRQQPMQEHGLPIEVYCFSRERELVPFEALQSRIGELVLVTLSQFGLRLFQSPSAWQFHCQAAETVILTDAERK